MNNKIILATSDLAYTENLFNCINELIENTEPMIIEASISGDRRLSNKFPDTRSMQEARDLSLYNKESFEKNCIKLHIKHATRPQFENYFFEDLIEDSWFADLIVCSFNLLSDGSNHYQINSEVQPTLRKLGCPILIVPENLKGLMPVDLFTFDGSSDSMQAIKTFTYLFPQRCNRQVLIFNSLISDAEQHEAAAWFSAHYLKFKWIDELPPERQYNAVCGSFGRSSSSYLLKKSFATELFAFHKNPVFICHS